MLLQPAKAAQQPAAALPELLADLHQALLQIQRGAGQLGRGVSDQRQPLLQPGHETSIQVAITQQRQQGGRQPQGELGPLAWIGSRRLQHLQQRQIALLQGLEVPVLLKGALFPRPHIGEMGVKHEGQIACRHSLASKIAV